LYKEQTIKDFLNKTVS